MSAEGVELTVPPLAAKDPVQFRLLFILFHVYSRDSATERGHVVQKLLDWILNSEISFVYERGFIKMWAFNISSEIYYKDEGRGVR